MKAVGLFVLLIITVLAISGGVLLVNSINDKLDTAKNYCEKELSGQFESNTLDHLKCYVEEGELIVKHELIKFGDGWRIVG